MNNDKRYGNNNSKKESLTFAILFGIIGIIWTFIQKQYLLGPNLSYIYVLVTSVLIYLAAYKKIEKNKRINYELRDSLKEISAVKEEKQSCEVSLENQLLMTENLLREINLGVISWDKSLKIIGVNPYFLKITKYEEEELISKNVGDIYIGEDNIEYSGKTLNDILDIINKKENTMRIKGKNEDVLEFSTYHMTVKDPSGEIVEVLTFAIDITEKNKLEKNLDIWHIMMI